MSYEFTQNKNEWKYSAVKILLRSFFWASYFIFQQSPSPYPLKKQQKNQTLPPSPICLPPICLPSSRILESPLVLGQTTNNLTTLWTKLSSSSCHQSRPLAKFHDHVNPVDVYITWNTEQHSPNWYISEQSYGKAKGLIGIKTELKLSFSFQLWEFSNFLYLLNSSTRPIWVSKFGCGENCYFLVL